MKCKGRGANCTLHVEETSGLICISIIILGDVDYARTDVVVTFDPTSSSSSCFDVSVLDDSIVEPNEGFSLELTTNDTAALLPILSVSVTIVDNDGKWAF